MKLITSLISIFNKSSTIKRKIFSGSAWAFTGRIATMLTGILSNALLARLLSPQDLGIYFLALSIVTFGAMFGSLGMTRVAVRMVAENTGLNLPERARSSVKKISVAVTIGSIASGAVYLLLGNVLIERIFNSPALAAVTGIVAGWMVVKSIQSVIPGVFRGFHDIKLAAFFGGLATRIVFIACLITVYWISGHGDLVLVLVLSLCSGIASAILAGWLLFRKLQSLPVSNRNEDISYRELLGIAMPLLITSVATFVFTQADIWILGAFRTAEEVALYGAAARLVLLIRTPLMVVNAVTPPVIAEMYSQKKNGNWNPCSAELPLWQGFLPQHC